jgi:hypothetical protein
MGEVYQSIQYTIHNSRGLLCSPYDAGYGSLGEAKKALKKHHGWARVYLVTCPTSTSEVGGWYAYGSARERDADQTRSADQIHIRIS